MGVEFSLASILDSFDLILTLALGSFAVTLLIIGHWLNYVLSHPGRWKDQGCGPHMLIKSISCGSTINTQKEPAVHSNILTRVRIETINSRFCVNKYWHKSPVSNSQIGLCKHELELEFVTNDSLHRTLSLGQINRSKCSAGVVFKQVPTVS